MKSKSRNPRIDGKKVLILTGCLLLAFLALMVTYKFIPMPQEVQPNEYEVHAIVSEAADDYLRAGTFEERQAAARKVRSLRGESRSVDPKSREQSLDILRVILFTTIVVLAWKLLQLVFSGMNYRKAPIV